MSEQPSTLPDWNAARRLAKDSIAMATLILDAVNASARKSPAKPRRQNKRRQKKSNR